MLKNLLLAFQLENYKNTRFLHFIYSHFSFWIRGSQRQELIWTKKVKLLFFLTLLLFLTDFIGALYTLIFFHLSLGLLVIIIPLMIFSLPLYFVVANIFLFPLDIFLKKRIIKKARKKLSTMKNLTVIGITGSYGKTSTKNMIASVLETKYNIIITEGNKNTPLGVSEVILKKLNNKTEIFIVEMGAYGPGEIKALCDIVKPKIGILTGITLQHLERFKSLDNIIKAKFELLESLPENGFALVDITSEGAKKGYKEYEERLKVKNVKTITSLKDFSYLDNFEGIRFSIDSEVFQIKLIVKHAINTAQIAYELGKYFKIPKEEIKESIEKTTFIKHRMEVIHNKNTEVIVIDDSYNGNIEGIKSIIDLLKNTKISGRKIIIAGGIVELGNKLKEVNEKVGEDFSSCADMILLSKGPVGEAILSGLKKAHFEEKNIKFYNHSLDIHNDLKNIVKKGDVIIFQNDLTDNYL